jgi:hypothetical protein
VTSMNNSTEKKCVTLPNFRRVLSYSSSKKIDRHIY